MLLPSKQYQDYNAGFSEQCREAGVDKLALDGRYNIACLYDKENPHVDIMITPTNEPDPFI